MERFHGKFTESSGWGRPDERPGGKAWLKGLMERSDEAAHEKRAKDTDNFLSR
jgi:hypothetical protein